MACSGVSAQPVPLVGTRLFATGLTSRTRGYCATPAPTTERQARCVDEFLSRRAAFFANSLLRIRSNARVNSDIQRVAAWLQPEGIHLDVPLRDSRHALEFIADAIAGHHALEPAPVFRALWRREQAGSTGLGAGFAVPHARPPASQYLSSR